ncbi:MAG: galactokinase [Omnitrophica WOR_2 bacterium GWA2_47_8]|nr:MAG: galactokinase [Omnitrophica WOR_2 bacterium GWA2_47_8]
MIITRTPLRISIGGGGTDLPHYYSKHKGFLITATINKYIYIVLHPRTFYNESLIRWSQMEVVKSINEIKHTRIRESLRYMGVTEPIEVTSMADVPAQTGLGSSSSFLVGLLNALHTYKNEFASAATLAEEACEIDLDILKEPMGKQDQYAAAYGGILQLDINQKGKVMAGRLDIDHYTVEDLQNNLFLFYTGIKRDANTVLADQKKGAEEDPRKMEGMHQTKMIGMEIKKALEKGDTRKFGEWLNIHWEHKKKFSSKMTNPLIDKWYNLALENGAIGGKVVGAGGGGFLMFYCESNQKKFRKAMIEAGLRELPFQFEFDGSKVVFNA